MSGLARVTQALAITVTIAAACTGDARPTLPTQELPVGTTLTLASDQLLEFEAGGTSPEAVRVRATANGRPITGVRVEFSVPADLGRLSQPSASTDDDGWAESWLLDARPGEGSVRARLGDAMAERAVRILTAPATIEIEPSSGAIGLPGFPPPDPVVRARVTDTEGAPMPGQRVIFAWAGAVTTATDTSDADGWVEGRLGASPLEAGDWSVFALIPGRPIADIDRRVTEPVARRIVLVSVDGLRADAVSPTRTPTLTALAAGGAFLPNARSLEPTLSVPANLSLLAGEGPPSHRLFSEDLDFTPEMNRLDPLFRVGLRRGQATSAVLSSFGHLARFDQILECRLAFGFDPLVAVPGGAPDVIDAALPLLAADGPDMLFLHLPDVDVAGHAHGWSSPEYVAAVTDTDAEIGRLVAALPADALLLLTSAHGGGGALGDFQHGSTDDADILVPLILSGPGVVPGTVLSSADLLDVAPTLAWGLGWASPSRWNGAALLDAFGGTRPGHSGRTVP